MQVGGFCVISRSSGATVALTFVLTATAAFGQEAAVATGVDTPLLQAAAAAAAQAAPAQTAAQTPPPAQPTAGFQDGFFIQTANGDNRLLFGFIGQLDGRFSVDDPLPITEIYILNTSWA